jgi:hypothetical protein
MIPIDVLTIQTYAEMFPVDVKIISTYADLFLVFVIFIPADVILVSTDVKQIRENVELGLFSKLCQLVSGKEDGRANASYSAREPGS